jgi:peroxiredoxin
VLLKHFVAAGALAVCLMTQPTHAAELPDEIKAVVAKVQAKLTAGQVTEKQLTPEILEFDALTAKYRQTAPEDAAQAAFAKGVLYAQVFTDFKQSAQVMELIAKDFPETESAKQVPAVLASLRQLEAAQKLEASLKLGAQFPDFAVNDMSGKPLAVANYKGRVVLLDFWATWCGPCIAELPNLKKTYEKHHANGFEIIGVSLDQDKALLTAFLEKNGMPWVQYFSNPEVPNTLAERYGIRSIPSTFLLDGAGKIIAKGLRGDDLELAVGKALVK